VRCATHRRPRTVAAAAVAAAAIAADSNIETIIRKKIPRRVFRTFAKAVVQCARDMSDPPSASAAAAEDPNCTVAAVQTPPPAHRQQQQQQQVDDAPVRCSPARQHQNGGSPAAMAAAAAAVTASPDTPRKRGTRKISRDPARSLLLVMTYVRLEFVCRTAGGRE